MVILSDVELNELCVYLRDYDNYYWFQTREFLRMQYNTGCRSRELFEISRWSIRDDGLVSLMPFKNNNERTFAPELFTDSFIENIVSQTKPFSGLTLRQLWFQVQKVFPFPDVKCNDKVMDAYLFRYNRVRLMRGSGLSFDEIKKQFGWKSNDMAPRYASAALYYD